MDNAERKGFRFTSMITKPFNFPLKFCRLAYTVQHRAQVYMDTSTSLTDEFTLSITKR